MVHRRAPRARRAFGRPPVGRLVFAFVIATLFSSAQPVPTVAQATGVTPGAVWATRTPGEVGLDPAKLGELAALVGGSGVVVRHGWLVYSWGDPTTTADWASASKPVLSTLLFRAADLGLCALEDTIGPWMDGGSAKDRSITFRSLANMISGYSRAESPTEAWAYNDYAINLYGYVLCERVWGMPPSALFAQELGVLQFEDPVVVGDAQRGRLHAMSVRDFARLGLLWLRRGDWDGTTVVTAARFENLSQPVSPTLPVTSADGPESWDLDTYGGSDDQTTEGPGHYAMNFWVNVNGLWPGYAGDIFQANGHFGQKVCFVIPGLDLVAVGVGSWGGPGEPTSVEVVRLLHEADSGSSVAAPEPRETSWSRVKAAYRVR